jgi:GH15 family glucan-1,4-alpha-glucosidase
LSVDAVLHREELGDSLTDMIEVVRFQLKGGRDVDEFLATNERYQHDFAYQQKGLVRRTVARGRDGAWLSLTLWRSRGHAESARSAAVESAVAVEFIDFLETSASTTEYFEELSG